MIAGTKHFPPGDFDQPARWGFPRTPPPASMETNAQRTLVELAEPIRSAAGRLQVLSAYRSREYNSRIEGAPDSLHQECRALDLAPLDIGATELQSVVLLLLGQGRLPTLGGLGFYRWGVHVDNRPKPASGKIAAWGGAETALAAAGLRYGAKSTAAVVGVPAFSGKAIAAGAVVSGILWWVLR